MSPEDSLKEKLGSGELERKIGEKQKAFSGLLTREGSLKLIALEEGLASEAQKEPVQVKVSQALAQAPEALSTMVVRVKKVLCAKEFEKDGRSGRVCNVVVGDETGEAALVLWGQDADFAERKLERNVCILAENFSLKNGELHSTLYTKISSCEPTPGLPSFSMQAKKLSEAGEGDDFFARVAGKSQMREFEREGRKGYVLNLVLEDPTGQRNIACWNRNAHIADFLREGDVVKVEGVSVKNGELQASWMTHVIAHAKNHSLPELEFKPLSLVMPEEVAFVNVTLEKMLDGRLSRKCSSCRKPADGAEAKCSECGAQVRELFFMVADVKDCLEESSRSRLVFFSEQAFELLGLRKTLLSPELVFQLKRDFMEGKALKIKAQAKTRADGGVEFVAKQTRSH